MLRYAADRKAVLERLSHHPTLVPCLTRERFKISCEDQPTESFLKQISYYTPLTFPISNPVSLIANNGTHPSYENWLGVQDEERIDLYYPAYQSASTLAFTFFHELGHWLHKRPCVFGESDWDSYIDLRFPNFELSKEDDLVDLYECFANDFAWYCSSPSYLKSRYPSVFDWFASGFRANSC